MKVAHLTSVHNRYDTRIFHKECKTLQGAGYQIVLIVADGLGDEVKDGVSFIDVGKPASRLGRMLKSTRQVYQAALKTNADIFHIHDPELIPTGVKLKRKGKKVIFDAHESITSQILSKHYIPLFLRKFVACFYSKFERRNVAKFDAVVTATPHIRKEFESFCDRVEDIKNYPLLNEFLDITLNTRKNRQCIYLGTLDEPRGIREIVEALSYSKNIRLKLAGKFGDAKFQQELMGLANWKNVDYVGFLSREETKSALSESMVGLVTLHPTPNYVHGLPVKLFEYMSAGLPVIASDIPMWQQIVEDANCGICVNPMRPRDIGEKLDYLLANPEIAKRMGENGRKAVIEKYNWDKETPVLLELYRSLI